MLLISAGNVDRGGSEMNELSTLPRDIYWCGLIYKSGSQAGAESLRELAEVREEEIPKYATRLKGIYFVAVHCKNSGRIYSFGDSAGLYHAFYSSKFVCTSFLQLARLERYTRWDIDPEALVEFFHFGCIYEDRTFFPGIRKINPDTVVCCDSNGSISFLRKPLADIAVLPQRSFDALLEDFALAARAERVSVDITGGADSRLLATALAYFGLPFETATSGRQGIPDLRIGERVAAALGRPFYPTYHSAERCDWEELFLLSDGMFDVTKNSRLIQLQHDRKDRGVTLSVSGAAGEGFRENWWMHDFPFYKRREARLSRLYALRLAPQPLRHGLLGGRFRPYSERQRESLLRRASRYAVPGNTRTYDRIYYYLQLRAWCGTFVTSSIKLLRVGVPYADNEFIRVGYHLPRMQRVLNRFHRKMISKYSSKAASLPTTESGVTLGAGPLAMSRDLSRYLADRSKPLQRKSGSKW
jgi:hypothetical protein